MRNAIKLTLSWNVTSQLIDTFLIQNIFVIASLVNFFWQCKGGAWQTMILGRVDLILGGLDTNWDTPSNFHNRPKPVQSSKILFTSPIQPGAK